jgi:hypothetical protein
MTLHPSSTATHPASLPPPSRLLLLTHLTVLLANVVAAMAAAAAAPAPAAAPVGCSVRVGVSEQAARQAKEHLKDRRSEGEARRMDDDEGKGKGKQVAVGVVSHHKNRISGTGTTGLPPSIIHTTQHNQERARNKDTRAFPVEMSTLFFGGNSCLLEARKDKQHPSLPGRRRRNGESKRKMWHMRRDRDVWVSGRHLLSLSTLCPTT